MEIEIILLITWIHFFADFVCQTDKMAINKSTSNKWLAIHVSVYSVFFLVFGSIAYVLVNFVLHIITDYFSSRASSALWKAEKRHWFFVVVGLDQAIHMSCLFLTYLWLF